MNKRTDLEELKRENRALEAYRRVVSANIDYCCKTLLEEHKSTDVCMVPDVRAWLRELHRAGSRAYDEALRDSR